MIIPEKLKRAVGPFDLKIKSEPHPILGSLAVRGKFDPDTNEIVLAAENSKAQNQETFWHEIIEAIDAQYALKIEHGTIEVLGMGIAQVIASLEEAYGKEIGS